MSKDGVQVVELAVPSAAVTVAVMEHEPSRSHLQSETAMVGLGQ